MSFYSARLNVKKACVKNYYKLRTMWQGKHSEQGGASRGELRILTIMPSVCPPLIPFEPIGRF
jgi:hypothetical protein